MNTEGDEFQYDLIGGLGAIGEPAQLANGHASKVYYLPDYAMLTCVGVHFVKVLCVIISWNQQLYCVVILKPVIDDVGMSNSTWAY